MLNILHLLISLGIFWTSFNRALLMDKETHIQIALCMAFLGTMGLAMALAPYAWGTCITAPLVVFEASVLLVQTTTARFWSKGVPAAFRKP